MNKINRLILGILVVSIMITTATAYPSYHPPSSNDVITTTCDPGCHGVPATTFCVKCHAYPTFILSVSASPTSVTADTATPVTFTVRNTGTATQMGPVVNGALVSLTGAGVPTGTSGSTDTSGKVTISVNATLSGTITATATKTSYTSGTAAVIVIAPAQTPVLTTITVAPATANLLIGKTQLFTAAANDQNGNVMTPVLSWTSSNGTVGTIDASGNFSALAEGTTTIKAANGTVNGTASVTVTSSAPTSVLTTITVTPVTANLLIGGTQKFTAVANDQNGNVMTPVLSWTSSNGTVGTIDASGNFSALAEGTTTIKAANGTVNGTASVTVTTAIQTPVLTTIKVTPPTAKIIVGKNRSFMAKTFDQFNHKISALVTWTSSNETVGTIDASGNFIALTAGTTTIKAANGTVNGTASVTVTTTVKIPVLTTIKVTPPTAKIIVGKNRSFMAKTFDQFNHKISALVTWASSNTSVGTIDNSGKFTALSAGTTTLTATNGTINGYATITVKAKSSGHVDDDHKEGKPEEHKEDKQKEN